MRIAIIGGGITGIIAANELSKNPSFKITLFESKDFLGGLSQSIEIDNLNYDIGTFLYPDNHSLFETFPFVKDSYLPISHFPMTLKGENKFDAYPLSFKGYWKNFGTLNFIISSFSLLFAKLKYANYKTLPEYCKYYVGDSVYKKSGLQRYIKRLYKNDDVSIDIKLGVSRIKRICKYSIRKMLKRAFSLNKDFVFNATKNTFYVRPKSGFKGVFEQLESHLLSKKVTICKNINIQTIYKLDDKFVINNEFNSETYDRVVSTIPFTVTQHLIGMKPSFVPKYMKLITLFYKGNCKFDSNVLYNFTPEGEWKRITVYSKYYGIVDNLDYFSVEITVSDINELTIEKAKTEFEVLAAKYKLVDLIDFQGSNITPFAYPVFNIGEPDKARKELGKIKDFGIDLSGRQGTFEYLSSDETIRKTQDYIRNNFNI